MAKKAFVLLALDLLVKIDANLLEYVVCHIVILVVCDDICRSCRPWRGAWQDTCYEGSACTVPCLWTVVALAAVVAMRCLQILD